MVDMNTPAAAEQVAEIECRIPTIKERSRVITCTLPYKALPNQILIRLLHFVVMSINNMPSASGISTQYSPRGLILCTRLKYKQNCHAQFVSYCKVHEDNQPTNTMTMVFLTTPAICCGPTGNLQDSYFFFSLVTGLLIKCRKWSELPVPDAVIEWVPHFTDKAGSPPGIVFSNRHCQPYDWPDNDIIGSNDTPMAIYPDIRADIPGVQLAS